MHLRIGRWSGEEEDDHVSGDRGWGCKLSMNMLKCTRLFPVSILKLWPDRIIPSKVPHPQYRYPPLLFHAIVGALGKVLEFLSFFKNCRVHVECLRANPVLVDMPYLLPEHFAFCFTAYAMADTVVGHPGPCPQPPVTLPVSAEDEGTNCTVYCVPCNSGGHAVPSWAIAQNEIFRGLSFN